MGNRWSGSNRSREQRRGGNGRAPRRVVLSETAAVSAGVDYSDGEEDSDEDGWEEEVNPEL